MRSKRRQHLLRLLEHARLVQTLTAEEKRLERRLRHCRQLVFGRQRCTEGGCVLIERSAGEAGGEHQTGAREQQSQQCGLVVSVYERFQRYLAREREHCEEEGCIMHVSMKHDAVA